MNPRIWRFILELPESLNSWLPSDLRTRASISARLRSAAVAPLTIEQGDWKETIEDTELSALIREVIYCYRAAVKAVEDYERTGSFE